MLHMLMNRLSTFKINIHNVTMLTLLVQGDLDSVGILCTLCTQAIFLSSALHYGKARPRFV